MTLPLFAGDKAKDDSQATFFVGRLKYSSNDGNDCSSVGENMLRLVAKASTIHVREERHIKLTDPDLYDTPFIFMNGHNNFVLNDAEIQNLRKYLDHGGFVFGSGCCTNPEFPKAWRREFSRIFPNEPVRSLAYDHPIYRAFYKIDRIHCQDENKDVHLEGITHHDSLVAVLCEDGLCCAFAEGGSCNRGKGISPDDGRKLALNIAVYSLTH